MRSKTSIGRVREPSKTFEIIELLSFAVVIFLTSFIMPLAIRGYDNFFTRYNQFFIGPVVNFVLILAGVRFKSRVKTLCTICLPSVFALSAGLITGGIYTLYMIPVIWLGNLVIVFTFRTLREKDITVASYAPVAIIAVFLKAAVIFGGYNLLCVFNVIPSGSPAAAALWTAMGLNQLINAAIGSLFAFGALKTL